MCYWRWSYKKWSQFYILKTNFICLNVVVVQPLSPAWLPAIPWTGAHQAFMSFTISWSLLKVMSIESIPPSVTPEGILLVLNPSQYQSLFQCQHFALGGQSIGPSASVLLMNIQSWFPLGLTGLISLLTKRLSRVFSSSTVQKHQFFSAQPSLWSNSHICNLQ